jgi:hypothetical protein
MAIVNVIGGLDAKNCHEAPKKAPIRRWLPWNGTGRQWIRRRDLSAGFLGISSNFAETVDVLGRLRTLLDGGPCSYRTSVITDCFYLLYLAPILAKPPTMPPPKGVAVAGQYWNH